MHFLRYASDIKLKNVFSFLLDSSLCVGQVKVWVYSLNEDPWNPSFSIAAVSHHLGPQENHLAAL